MKKISLVFLTLFLFMNLVSAQRPINVEIELPKVYQNVPAGEDLWFTTKIINLASQERIDITLKYEVYSESKQLMTSKSETVAVGTQSSFVGNINIPQSSKEGLYKLKITVVPVAASFEESEAETSFNVVAPEIKTEQVNLVFYALMGLLSLGALIFTIRKSKPLVKKMVIRTKIRKLVKKRIKQP